MNINYKGLIETGTLAHRQGAQKDYKIMDIYVEFRVRRQLSRSEDAI